MRALNCCVNNRLPLYLADGGVEPRLSAACDEESIEKFVSFMIFCVRFTFILRLDSDELSFKWLIWGDDFVLIASWLEFSIGKPLSVSLSKLSTLSGDTAMFVTFLSGGVTRSPFSSRVVRNRNTLKINCKNYQTLRSKQWVITDFLPLLVWYLIFHSCQYRACLYCAQVQRRTSRTLIFASMVAQN